MSGLISNEINYQMTEVCAGDEAYTEWLDGYFVDDNNRWRFFTGTRSLRIYGCRAEEDWQLRLEHVPVEFMQRVATYLQEEYNNLAHKE